MPERPFKHRRWTVEDWWNEIERGLRYRQVYGMETFWAQLEDLFYNRDTTSATVGPNILLATGDALLSQLSVPNPYISVRAAHPEAVPKAPLVERMDNLFLQDLNLQEEIENLAINTYLFGRGILKIGYDSEYGYDPSLDIMGREPLGMTLSRVDRKGLPIEFNRYSPGMPWARSVLPHDIVVPWGTKEIENDARWVAHRVVRHVDEVKADSKYHNTRDLQPVMSMEDFVASYTSVLKPYRIGQRAWAGRGKTLSDAVEYVELWEIHDRQTGHLKVIATGHDKFLRDEPNALQLDGQLPFVSVCFVPNTRTFWVTPDAYYLRFAQLELADIALVATKQRRQSVLKFLYQEGAIEDVELEKAQSRDVGVAVKINGGYSAAEAITTFQPGSNLNLYQDEQYVRNNAREQVGFSRNQFGEFAGRRTSASEAQIVDRATALRMSRRELRVRRAYRELFKRINSIIFEYWRAPQVIDVLGPDGAQRWMRFTGPALKGRYTYNVDLSDDQGQEGRRAQALQLYAMLMQDPSVDPVALREFLTRAYNDPSFSQLFQGGQAQGQAQPGQLPMAQGQGQGQLQLPAPQQ